MKLYLIVVSLVSQFLHFSNGFEERREIGIRSAMRQPSNCSELWVTSTDDSGSSSSPKCFCTTQLIRCVGSDVRGTPKDDKKHINDDFLLQFESNRFRSVKEMTIVGIKLPYLPPHIFGRGVIHEHLQILNLSSNHFSDVSKFAFTVSGNRETNIPSLRTLVLTDNIIQLNDSNAGFLRPLAHTLRYLNLRRAFAKLPSSDSVGRRQRSKMLYKMFDVANFYKLTHLDLSENDLDELPPNFFCRLRNLQKLDLVSNSITNWLKLVASCINNDLHIDYSLESSIVDASRDDSNSLNREFVDFLGNLESRVHFTLAGRSVVCVANNSDIIEYLQTVPNQVWIPDAITCGAAVPSQFEGMPLMQVNTSQLECCLRVTSLASHLTQTTIPVLVGIVWYLR